MTTSRAKAAPQHKKRELSAPQLAAVVTVIAVVAVILVSYGAAGSYDGLWHLAATHQVPLPRLVPLGLDGGLIGVILLDITLTWAGRPLAWLRFAARVFALGTLAANAAAGWPDPVAVFLRIFAPALIVVITEAIRTVLLDRVREERDPVPLARWILAPLPTFRLWRRMILWRVSDYGAAVDMEISRRQAIVRLTAHYPGEDWRKAAPGDLAWALRNGLKMEDALAAVAELTRAPEAEVPARASGRKRPRPSARKRPGTRGRKPQRSSGPEPTPDADLATEARALEILGKTPGISGSALGRELGTSERYGRDLLKRLTAAR